VNAAATPTQQRADGPAAPRRPLLRRLRWYDWLIVAVVLVIAAAVVVNGISHTRDTHRLRADKAIFLKWAATHGGRSTWSRPVVKQRSTLDTACANHLLPNRAARPDYRICLFISRHAGPARIVKTTRGPPRKISVLENTGQAGPG
jgi:hypothetical protein